MFYGNFVAVVFVDWMFWVVLRIWVYCGLVCVCVCFRLVVTVLVTLVVSVAPRLGLSRIGVCVGWLAFCVLYVVLGLVGLRADAGGCCLFRLVLRLHSFCVACVSCRWVGWYGFCVCWMFRFACFRLLLLCELLAEVLGVFVVARVCLGLVR